MSNKKAYEGVVFNIKKYCSTCCKWSRNACEHNYDGRSLKEKQAVSDELTRVFNVMCKSVYSDCVSGILGDNRSLMQVIDFR